MGKSWEFLCVRSGVGEAAVGRSSSSGVVRIERMRDSRWKEPAVLLWKVDVAACHGRPPWYNNTYKLQHKHHANPS